MAIEMEKGSVSIEAENIMPVIKRWLYSDKDIFLREVVSNGCDAITKYKMLHTGTEEAMSVTVTVDKEAKTLTISDTGIGMTADEVRRYINQVAFSSATEFMKQFADEKKDGDIIGHFGLGFYSVFMVSDRVEIQTLSHEEGASPVHWESEDGMAFTISDGNRTTHGTDIILHVSEEEKEFLELYRVREVLKRYCAYMTSPVMVFDANSKPTEPEVGTGEFDADGKEIKQKVMVDPKPEQVNETSPLWLRKPSDCTDEESKEFYRKTFNDYTDPLFWIHLNVDYPFHLKGILYFPKLKQEFGVREGQIKLFSGQVFVADNVKEIIPEFLLMLKGVIDCPDIPLNVSRSYLQNDGFVKKLSAHITKKVADKLVSLFNTARSDYESYWTDIAPFVKYGCLTDNKFYDAVKDVLLYKLTDDTFVTLSEYRAKNDEKTDKKVYYTSDAKRQAGSVALYTRRGIDVAVMDFPEIDASFLNFMEYRGVDKDNEVHFARVDADVSGLTEDSEDGKDLNADALQTLFRTALDNKELEVTLAAMADEELTAMVTEDEQSRRFKELYRMKDMPDTYALVLNRRNKTIQSLAARDAADELTLELARQIYDLARMAAAPLEPAQITAFLARSQKLMGMLV